MFSSRIPNRLTSNLIDREVNNARASRIDIIDLTDSNPTTAGFHYPTELLDVLSSPALLEYKPEPLGLLSARNAVANHLQRYGLKIDANKIILTTSTSEAYSLLFKLLCNAGDQVIVPRPSYPLFEHLTRLEAIEVQTYELEYNERWEINLAKLLECINSKTRAILLVNPNNPTGSFLSTDEIDSVLEICLRNDLALIVDEVFGFYSMTDTPRGPSILDHDTEVLTFSLGGLSKSVGLPQFKLGWIVVNGSDTLVGLTRSRLEFICDTYLSVATPVQFALDAIFEHGMTITSQIGQRIRQNYATLKDLTENYPASKLLSIDGGWYAPVQVPATRSEEAMVIDLLKQQNILVNPGYFFDFPREAFLVVSLLINTELFKNALMRVLAEVGGRKQSIR